MTFNAKQLLSETDPLRPLGIFAILTFLTVFLPLSQLVCIAIVDILLSIVGVVDQGRIIHHPLVWGIIPAVMNGVISGIATSIASNRKQGVFLGCAFGVFTLAVLVNTGPIVIL